MCPFKHGLGNTGGLAGPRAWGWCTAVCPGTKSHGRTIATVISAISEFWTGSVVRSISNSQSTSLEDWIRLGIFVRTSLRSSGKDFRICFRLLSNNFNENLSGNPGTLSRMMWPHTLAAASVGNTSNFEQSSGKSQHRLHSVWQLCPGTLLLPWSAADLPYLEWPQRVSGCPRGTCLPECTGWCRHDPYRIDSNRVVDLLYTYCISDRSQSVQGYDPNN